MKIFMVFLGVYLLVSLAMAGVGMYFALEKIFPDEDPFLMVNRFIIYSFLLEIFEVENDQDEILGQKLT